MRVQFDADGTASMSTQDGVSCTATWQATETRLALSEVTCDPDVGVDDQSLDVELVLDPRSTAGTGQDCFAVGGALGLPFCRVA